MDFGFLDSEEHSVDSKFDEFLVSLNLLVNKHCPKEVKQKNSETQKQTLDQQSNSEDNEDQGQSLSTIQTN